MNRRAFFGTAIGAVAYAQSASRPSAIDVHAHYFPQQFFESLKTEGPAPGFDIDFTPAGPVLVQGSVRTTLDPTYWDLTQRIRRMDAQGIAVHVLSLTNPMVHWSPPA